jgi:hypothetical protein
MASILTLTVLHVSTGYVTDRMDIAHMDVFRALKETVVNFLFQQYRGGRIYWLRRKSMTCRKSLTNLITLCSITLVYIPITTRHTAHESTRYVCFG